MNTLPESMVEKIISEKIKEWHQKKEKKPDGDSLAMFPSVALSREFGCQEEVLIPKLEQTLGWKVYGKNVLDHICQREGLSRDVMDTVDDQTHSKIKQWVQHLTHSGTLSQADYVQQISKYIRVIAGHESAIFLGRGAGYILSENPDCLKVLLTAPFEKRVAHVMELREIDQPSAEKLVHETDEGRAKFIQKYFGQKPKSIDAYDVVLNTATVSEDAICQTIKNLATGQIRN